MPSEVKINPTHVCHFSASDRTDYLHPVSECYIWQETSKRPRARPNSERRGSNQSTELNVFGEGSMQTSEHRSGICSPPRNSTDPFFSELGLASHALGNRPNQQRKYGTCRVDINLTNQHSTLTLSDTYLYDH